MPECRRSSLSSPESSYPICSPGQWCDRLAIAALAVRGALDTGGDTRFRPSHLAGRGASLELDGLRPWNECTLIGTLGQASLCSASARGSPAQDRAVAYDTVARHAEQVCRLVTPSCPGLSRASTSFPGCRTTWMAGTSPAMTTLRKTSTKLDPHVR